MSAKRTSASGPSPARAQRCAVYTRKSTEHNLDLAFNSLDAQREACEAYIKSQSHEGWQLLPARYDDGGLSGASLDRPALSELLANVRAGKIDVVVVYKVDRLTRSLADFAKLVELFDAHGVSFVSVTQSFNTTSSMGLLTLNVLLSFAQFEREVIGERVRDKIAASKRKGLWTGGGVPFGYRSQSKRLVVDPAEAATVQTIFERYLIAGSIGALIEDLDTLGVRPKPLQRKGSSCVGRRYFQRGPLAYLLKNRLYLGEVVYRGETYRGAHAAIIDRDLFEAVQRRLGANESARAEVRRRGRQLLSGLVFDDRGNAMSPSHATKNGVRYRYYVSQAILQGRKAEAGLVTRVSAPEIEAQVIAALRRHLAEQAIDDASSDDRALVETSLTRVTITAGSIELLIRHEPEPLRVVVPWTQRPAILAKGLTHAANGSSTIDPAARAALLVAIARARAWVDDLVAGRVGSFDALTQREGLGLRYVIRLATLACLSPRLVAAIVDCSAPAGLTVSSLSEGLPLTWAAQERTAGLG